MSDDSLRFDLQTLRQAVMLAMSLSAGASASDFDYASKLCIALGEAHHHQKDWLESLASAFALGLRNEIASAWREVQKAFGVTL